jgi:hypothetical protein
MSSAAGPELRWSSSPLACRIERDLHRSSLVPGKQLRPEFFSLHSCTIYDNCSFRRQASLLKSFKKIELIFEQMVTLLHRIAEVEVGLCL